MNYDRLAATAERLIRQFGSLITWRAISSMTTDADKPWEAVNRVPREYKIYAVIVPASSSNAIKELAVSLGANVPEGKETVYIGGKQAFVPTTDAQLVREIAGPPAVANVVLRPIIQVLRISAVQTLAPAGKPVLYALQVET